MTDRSPEAPSESGPDLSERTAASYREQLIPELEAEIDRLRQRADALQQTLEQRTSELRAFGVLAKAVHGAHRVLRQPSLLARVPAAAMRAARDGGGTSQPPAERRPSARPPTARRLPISGTGGRLPVARALTSLRVALIGDDALALALEPGCQLRRVTPSDWREAFATWRPDLLLVESAWRASRGAWQYRLAWYGHPLSIQLSDLRAITSWCTAEAIPTIFWETTGPAHRGRFDEVAALVDVILTSDPAAIGYYEALPNRRAAIVDLLEPGVQFQRHHPAQVTAPAGPAEPGEASDHPIFVGAYDPTVPLAEREALERLLDAGLGRGLRIYDTSGLDGPDGAGFPGRFQEAVVEMTTLEALPQLLRSAGVVLVDAGPDDGQRLPVRLLEALACGAPTVVTPSRAVRARFDADIPGAQPDDDPWAAIDRILAAPAEARRQVRAEVLPALARDFAIEERVGRLAAAAGLTMVDSSATIALAVLHDDPGRMAAVAADLGNVGEVAEILIGTTDWAGAGSALAGALRSARPFVPVRLAEQDPGSISAHRLERLAALAGADWIVPWSDGPGPVGPDPLEGLRLAVAFEPGDVADAEHPRLARAVRRQSILASGWPAAGSSGPGSAAIGVAGPT